MFLTLHFQILEIDIKLKKLIQEPEPWIQRLLRPVNEPKIILSLGFKATNRTSVKMFRLAALALSKFGLAKFSCLSLRATY